MVASAQKEYKQYYPKDAWVEQDPMEIWGTQSGVLREVLDKAAVVNNFLMQFQADILDVKVERPVLAEITALGACYFAGLATGFWKNQDEILANIQVDKTYLVEMGEKKREDLYKNWKRAVNRSLAWKEN